MSGFENGPGAGGTTGLFPHVCCVDLGGFTQCEPGIAKEAVQGIGLGVRYTGVLPCWVPKCPVTVHVSN